MTHPHDRAAAAARGAVVAEIGWRQRDGTVHLAARTPFVFDHHPALALTYDDVELAHRLAAAEEAVLVTSDARHSLRGWEPVAVPVAASLTYDPEGLTFTDELVEQELRKYPPARLRADSLLQRHENWWYLARVVVRLRPLSQPVATAPRHDADSGLLCWSTASGLMAEAVTVDDWSGDRLHPRSLAGTSPFRGSSAPAALLRHDFSTDRERHATLELTGRLDGDTFWPHARDGRAELPPVPGVWRRLRQERAFQRACRRAIEAAGH